VQWLFPHGKPDFDFVSDGVEKIDTNIQLWVYPFYEYGINKCSSILILATAYDSDVQGVI
jgi:hypothetical protein